MNAELLPTPPPPLPPPQKKPAPTSHDTERDLTGKTSATDDSSNTKTLPFGRNDFNTVDGLSDIKRSDHGQLRTGLRSLEPKSSVRNNHAGPPQGIPSRLGTTGAGPKQMFKPDGDQHTMKDAAKVLATAMRESGTFYSRGGEVIQCTKDKIQDVTPSSLLSYVEPPDIVFIHVKKSKNGTVELVNQAMTETLAKGLLASPALHEDLPKVDHIVPYPVLIPDKGGEDLQLCTDYDEERQLLVHGWSGQDLPAVTLEEAKNNIRQMFCDFKFQSEADRSRAYSMLLTRGLGAGFLLGENTRAPIFLFIADSSQTGKTYLCDVSGSVYNSIPSRVAQRKGGVGSLEESVSSVLVRGKPDVLMDNMRGGLDAQQIESFTTGSTFEARVPHRDTVTLDVRRTMLSITSNGMIATQDIANRAMFIRLCKQDDGYEFTEYPEGDLLDYVQANHGLLLASVYEIIREWWRKGRPATKETGHSFRAWVRPMDWIVQNIFDLPPLLEEHSVLQAQLVDKDTEWLMEVCRAVGSRHKLGNPMGASEFVKICESYGIELPGGGEDANVAMGKKLGSLVPDVNKGLQVGVWTVKRHWYKDDQSRDRNVYEINRVEDK